MKKVLSYCLILFGLLLSSQQCMSQINQDQLGAWYMYFWNTSNTKSPWGLQGDIQYRNWNLIGDLEQLLLRGGLTYKPEDASVKFTLGYANIQTGTMGNSNTTVNEHRIYQEALIPQKIAPRFFATHRFRFEERLVDNQDFRTRYRYNLFLNVPLNSKDMTKNTLYLALYNELFINAQKDIGNGKTVEYFDRNRFYTALGYVVQDGLKIQLGFMQQSLNTISKNQIQLSLHQKFN